MVQKTQHFFSLIALDHNHEQENDIIKGDGGAVGLTENLTALKRWMVAGPEIAGVLKSLSLPLKLQNPVTNVIMSKGHPSKRPFSRTSKHLIVYLKKWETLLRKIAPN